MNKEELIAKYAAGDISRDDILDDAELAQMWAEHNMEQRRLWNRDWRRACRQGQRWHRFLIDPEGS